MGTGQWWERWALAGWLGCSCALAGAEPEPARGFSAGFSQAARLARETRQALPPAKRDKTPANVVLLDKTAAPLLRSRTAATGEIGPVIEVSAGFIRLVDQLALAAALEKHQPGSLSRYREALSGAETPPAARPASAPPLPLEAENDHASRFNQIAGSLLAIETAQHYLGHYRKYDSALKAGPGTPLVALLTPAEWREAVVRGAEAGLGCGLGVEGLKLFYRQLAALPTRPAWVDQFMPREANAEKMAKELDRLEEYFFAGRKFK